MHIPVMREEVLAHLDPQPNTHFVDCTLGDGGHAEAILERTAPHGRLLGLEVNGESIRRAGERLKRFGKRVTIIRRNFRHLEDILAHADVGPIHGILFDLGWSSSELEENGRGFTFQKDEPLDMRLDETNTVTAAQMVNTATEATLGHVLKTYGEERLWRPIAHAIVTGRRQRHFRTTSELVALIEEVYQSHGIRRGRIHHATRVFQALRIAVNDELEALRAALPQALRSLKNDGRVVVISFHSLEDRIVKQFFRAHTDQLRIRTKKPLVPTREEVVRNRRARSARLRAAQKI